MSERIPLTQGQFAIVDDEDFEWLNQFKWCAHQSRSRFYARRRISTNQTVYMHRLIMQPLKGFQVDHRNHNTLDNRRRNLRICTNAENACNSKLSPQNTSGSIGVYWHVHSQKWCAEIKVNGVKYYLGLFDSKQIATQKRDEAAMRLHGEFARLNAA